MKADLTRYTFDPSKRFTGVVMQQGRVQLDADWNEQAAIFRRFLRDLAADCFGPYGGPAANLGFAVAPAANFDLNISPGRYYVAGFPCDAGTGVTYLKQPDYPSPPTLGAATYELYLDVWERLVTYVEDDSIREVALGGPDTSARTRLVWQVKAKQIATGQGSLGGNVSGPNGAVPNATVSATLSGTCATYSTKSDANGIYALQDIPAGKYDLTASAPGFATSVATNVQVDAGKTAEYNFPLAAGTPVATGPKLGDIGALFQSANRGLLKAVANQKGSSTDPCVIAPDASYRGPENQLYRVEIHTGGAAKTATFKWSRENGSVVFPIVNLSAGSGTTTVALESLGRDDRFGLSQGDWVEIQDDSYVLQNRAEPLLQVQSIDAGMQTVTLSGAPVSKVGQDATQHPLLRRWDETQGDDAEGGLTLSTDNAALITEGAWFNLEDGIQIQFQTSGEASTSQYRTGDYWLIPARTALGDIIWPRDSSGNPLAEPPNGVMHFYAPLAAITFGSDGAVTGQQHDCRYQVTSQAMSVQQ